MRLFWKVYLASLGSLLLCFALLTVIVSYRQAHDSLARLREEQRLLAITAASQVETGYYDQVWPFEMLSGIARDPQFVGWQIIDGNGVVVLSDAPVDSGHDPDLVTGRPRLMKIPGTDDEIWVIPMRMRVGARPWQFRLGYHTTAIDAQMRSTITTNALIGLGLAIVFIGISLYVTRRVLRPLDSLTRAVAEMERGNLDVSLPEPGTDEIGQLVTGFSAMVGSIKERDGRIHEQLGSLELAREELETRVILRTSELHASEARTRAIIQYAADAIITLDERGCIEVFNPAASRVFDFAPDEVIGQPFASVIPDCYSVRFDELGIVSTESGVPLAIPTSAEIRGRRRDGGTFPMQIALSEVEMEGKRMFTAIIRDISDRKRAEVEKQELHERLVVASRHVGMAEVATCVLHNVGNVLNSVNVSATVVSERLAGSRMVSLSKVVALLQEHEDDLGAFVTADERGRRMPAYLANLAEALQVERRSMMDELGSLMRDIEHIKQIVTNQQSIARVQVDVRELVSLDEAMEDATRISNSRFGEPVDLVREYAWTPQVNVDRHKIVHILVNLINNARQAVATRDGGAQIRLCIGTDDGAASVYMEVGDNGVGISSENLQRVFNHGFTTKPDGHGFGLHGAALSANEMGASLTVRSGGIGLGSSFRLELPVEPRTARPRSDSSGFGSGAT